MKNARETALGFSLCLNGKESCVSSHSVALYNLQGRQKKKMLINTQTNKRHELLSNGKGKSRTPFRYHTSEARGISSGICLGSAMFDKDVIPGESTEDKPRDSIKH